LLIEKRRNPEDISRGKRSVLLKESFNMKKIPDIVPLNIGLTYIIRQCYGALSYQFIQYSVIDAEYKKRRRVLSFLSIFLISLTSHLRAAYSKTRG